MYQILGSGGPGGREEVSENGTRTANTFVIYYDALLSTCYRKFYFKIFVAYFV